MRLQRKLSNLLTSLLAIAIFVVVFINVLMFLRQPGLVFHPAKQIEQTPTHWGMNFDTVTLATEDGLKLRGWYLPAPRSEKVLLFLHGNAGNMSHREASIKVFSQLRLNVLIFDYRGFGGSEGQPSEQGVYEDARTAWRYLINERKIKPENIIIFGRSLGGSVAAKLAAEVQSAGLILESTFSSLRDVVQEIFPVLSYFIYLRYDFNTVSVLHKVKSPVLVIHSRDDEIIPYVLGQKVFAAIAGKKQFGTIRGDHNYGFVQSEPAYSDALRNWLNGIFPLVVQSDLQARDAGV